MSADARVKCHACLRALAGHAILPCLVLGVVSLVCFFLVLVFGSGLVCCLFVLGSRSSWLALAFCCVLFLFFLLCVLPVSGNLALRRSVDVNV